MITFENMVRSKAHRILREMSSYAKFDLETYQNKSFEIPRSVDLDQLVGVYQNKGGSSVFITTRGILISGIETSDKFIRFADMEKIISPPSKEKTTLSVVRILLHNGGNFEIPIEGHGEIVRYRDAWGFYRFMSRIIDSYQKRHTNRVNS